MAGFTDEMKANLERKRRRKKASYLLNYSFAPDKTFRFLLSNLQGCQLPMTKFTELFAPPPSLNPPFNNTTAYRDIATVPDVRQDIIA